MFVLCNSWPISFCVSYSEFNKFLFVHPIFYFLFEIRKKWFSGVPSRVHPSRSLVKHMGLFFWNVPYQNFKFFWLILCQKMRYQKIYRLVWRLSNLVGSFESYDQKCAKKVQISEMAKNQNLKFLSNNFRFKQPIGPKFGIDI